MCPQVTLRCGQVVSRISFRIIGGVTGSRVAGFLARVPVEDIVVQRVKYWRPFGFHALG